MTNQNVNPLSMSDSDFLNSPIDFSSVDLDALPEGDAEDSTEAHETQEHRDFSTDSLEDTQEEVDQEGASEEEDDTYDEGDEAEGEDDSPQEDQEEDSTESEEAEKKPSLEELQAYGDISKIFAPFKANGKEFKVDSVDDVITLMQMGANYNKKMAALKPSLKVLKTLEANGLLDVDKINYLIDLDKKNPAAIGKLLQDSNFDAYSQDEEAIRNYRPQEYTVSDSEIALDEVVSSINHMPKFEETARILLQEWDETSKQEVVKQPEIIRYINEHVHNGIYDIIAKEIDKERILGRLNGVPTLVAYQQIGDRLASQGAFDHLAQGNSSQPNTQARIVKPAKNVNESDRRKKRAVTPPKSVSSSVPDSDDLNPLSMSDEEFKKIYLDRFI